MVKAHKAELDGAVHKVLGLEVGEFLEVQIGAGRRGRIGQGGNECLRKPDVRYGYGSGVVGIGRGRILELERRDEEGNGLGRVKECG